MENKNDSTPFYYWVLIIYFIVSQIYAVIFTIDYIKDDDTSTFEAIFFSGFVGEFKGLLWVFFA